MNDSQSKQAVYDIQDTIAAGYTLEPMKCRHCGHIGEVTYNQAVHDGHCAWCGEWQLNKED